jgi:hypothetical protein
LASANLPVEHAFPYRAEGNPPKPRPTLDVRLQFGTGEWTCRSLIDTGSPLTMFDRGAGEALGVRFNNSGARRGKITVLGGDWPVQFEDVDLCLPHDPEVVWTAHVAFVDDRGLRMPYQGILGHQGFLDRYAVTFNYYYDYFVLERPDDWHERRGKYVIGTPDDEYDLQWNRPTVD